MMINFLSIGLNPKELMLFKSSFFIWVFMSWLLLVNSLHGLIIKKVIILSWKGWTGLLLVLIGFTHTLIIVLEISLSYTLIMGLSLWILNINSSLGIGLSTLSTCGSLTPLARKLSNELGIHTLLVLELFNLRLKPLGLDLPSCIGIMRFLARLKNKS